METSVTIQNPEGTHQARTYAAATTRRDKTRERLSVIERLTMRLSDAGLRRRQTKLVYPDHRSPPSLTEGAPAARGYGSLEEYDAKSNVGSRSPSLRPQPLHTGAFGVVLQAAVRDLPVT